jgi:hypothetical protein
MVRVDGAKEAHLTRLAHARGHGSVADDGRVGKRKDAGPVVVVEGVQNKVVLASQLLPGRFDMRLEGPLQKTKGGAESGLRAVTMMS